MPTSDEYAYDSILSCNVKQTELLFLVFLPCLVELEGTGHRVNGGKDYEPTRKLLVSDESDYHIYNRVYRKQYCTDLALFEMDEKSEHQKNGEINNREVLPVARPKIRVSPAQT